jgi:hypothetical protein
MSDLGTVVLLIGITDTRLGAGRSGAEETDVMQAPD